MRGLAVFVVVAACGFDHGVLPGNGDAGGDGVPGDRDSDGIGDSVDNCPDLANADQHDWDADTHGDACDHCPHLPAADDPDIDGDGVGDPCDPRPMLAGDARAIWVAFYGAPDVAGWVNTGGGGSWTVSNGMLHQTKGGFSLLDSPMSYTDAYFATSLEVVQPEMAEAGFCLSDIQPDTQYYCCAAGSPLGITGIRAASKYVGSGTQISAPAVFAGNLAVGQHVEMTGTLFGVGFTCRVSQGAVWSTASTTTGGKLGPAVFYTLAPVNYRYAFVVTIGS